MTEDGLAGFRRALEALPDPELPMLSLGDLGIVHEVRTGQDGVVEVELTPTFLGCPAMAEIERSVRRLLAESGHPEARVRQALAPAWSTDRLSDRAHTRLSACGIVPPARGAGRASEPPSVRCPHCGSGSTRSAGPFGPTRCQALMTCTACGESFSRMRAV